MQLPDLSVVGNGNTVEVVVSDRKNDTSNEYNLTVGNTTNTFSFNFKIENIKTLIGSYHVQISKKNLAKFYSSHYKLTYFIALEPDSSYDE